MTTHPTFPSVTQMLPESKRLVVEALRSDRFKQGKYNLAVDEHDGEGVRHCCLGVMCEVAIENGVDIARIERKASTPAIERHFHADDTVYLAYDGETTLPPRRVLDWLYGPEVHKGMLQVVVDIDNGDDVVTKPEEFVYLNDDADWTFEQIAQAIEDSL